MEVYYRERWVYSARVVLSTSSALRGLIIVRRKRFDGWVFFF